MIKIFYASLILVLLLTVSGASFAAESEGRLCWSGEDGRKIFNDRSWADKPNYSEHTAARVQREHPNTHLFGQIKFALPSGRTKGFALCTYSNHVGLVFIVFARDATIENKPPCVQGACLQKPHWRSEWIEGSKDQDRPDRTHMDVCVIERDGIAYPSSNCPYFVAIPSE